MTNEQREIHRKKRVLEHAEKMRRQESVPADSGFGGEESANHHFFRQGASRLVSSASAATSQSQLSGGRCQPNLLGAAQ